MSKKRLEETRTRLKYGLGCLKHLRREIINSDDECLKDEINLLENDIKFLFEQAERAQKNAQDLVDMNMQLKGAQRLNTRYQETLEFYADRNNYLPEHLDPETDEKWSKIDYDEGFNARKTLGKECTNGRYRQTNFR